MDAIFKFNVIYLSLLFAFSALVLIILWRSKDTSTSKAIWTLIKVFIPLNGACLYLFYLGLQKNTKY